MSLRNFLQTEGMHGPTIRLLEPEPWDIIYACMWVLPKSSSVILTRTLAENHPFLQTPGCLIELCISSVIASGSREVLGKYHSTHCSLPPRHDHQPHPGPQHWPCLSPSFCDWLTGLLFIITVWKLPHSLASLPSISVSADNPASDVGSLADKFASAVAMGSTLLSAESQSLHTCPASRLFPPHRQEAGVSGHTFY